MNLKLWLIFLVGLLYFHVAKGAEVYTTVFNVFETRMKDKILVLSGADGRVYRLSQSEENYKKISSLLGEVVKLTYTTHGKEAYITEVRKVRPGEVSDETMDLNHFQFNQLRKFAPTDLKTLDSANEVFKSMLNDGDKKFSQCFKRAHMWSYDMWSKQGIFSQKIFIFYTQRFIQLQEFDWWFHVAPLVVVDGKDYVMDGTFFQKPMPVKQWQDYFLSSDKVSCPEIKNYLEYSQNQWSRLCYFMKVPMYYFTPLDIEHRDTKGLKKNHWVLEELQDARRAFKNYDRTYEGLDTGKPTVRY